MIVFPLLKILLCSWIILLIIQSISHNILTLTLISGVIVTSIPIALGFAWISGPIVFQTVFLFTLFVIAVILIHLIQLGLG
ncbi:MAG: hypothetical protein ACFE89_08035 [Candidatus Hodarchaeota archaeon]